jgi:hypothetical protein
VQHDNEGAFALFGYAQLDAIRFDEAELRAIHLKSFHFRIGSSLAIAHRRESHAQNNHRDKGESSSSQVHTSSFQEFQQ